MESHRWRQINEPEKCSKREFISKLAHLNGFIVKVPFWDKKNGWREQIDREMAHTHDITIMENRMRVNNIFLNIFHAISRVYYLTDGILSNFVCFLF
jgi:hypothetical protein